MMFSLTTEIKLVSKLPADPIDPVEDWAWGKLAKGVVYIATQTWGGILGEYLAQDVPGVTDLASVQGQLQHKSV